MEVHAEFGKRASAQIGKMSWTPSPIPGVDRKILDRIGDEVARATSIVRYAPGSHFSPHVHGGGEELLVLDGVFQDEYGDYPAGAYIRNPPTSRHTPRSAGGCTIFVKLWQFQPEDRHVARLETTSQSFVADPVRGEVHRLSLFHDAFEDVALEQWPADSEIVLTVRGGIEVLLLDGEFAEGGEAFEKAAWLRLPPGVPLRAWVGHQGARVWIKTGHLTGVCASDVRRRMGQAGR